MSYSDHSNQRYPSPGACSACTSHVKSVDQCTHTYMYHTGTYVPCVKSKLFNSCHTVTILTVTGRHVSRDAHDTWSVKPEMLPFDGLESAQCCPHKLFALFCKWLQLHSVGSCVKREPSNA